MAFRLPSYGAVSPECDKAGCGPACVEARGIVRVRVCKEGLRWSGICVCDSVVGGVTELAENGLDGVPVTLDGILGVTAEKPCDECEVGAGAVSEVSETA